MNLYLVGSTYGRLKKKTKKNPNVSGFFSITWVLLMQIIWNLLNSVFDHNMQVKLEFGLYFQSYSLFSCHHLASVVCKLFTFQASSPKPLGRLEPNLAGMFLGWSSTTLLFFVPVEYSIWLPGPIICHSQKSWVILLMNIHKPNRVMYDVSK